jgi:hypothetical protein
MIHFDFTVPDEDAEVIFDCMNGEINRCYERRLSYKTIESEWLIKHIEYLKALKKKMTNHLE